MLDEIVKTVEYEMMDLDLQFYNSSLINVPYICRHAVYEYHQVKTYMVVEVIICTIIFT